MYSLVLFNIGETIGLFLILLIVVSAFSMLARYLKNRFNKIVYIERDYQKFQKIERNLIYRLFLSAKDYKLAKLSMSMDNRDFKAVDETLDSLKNVRLDDNEKQLLNIIRLRNYLNQKDVTKARQLVENIKQRQQTTTNNLTPSLIHEMDMMLNVDYLKDSRYTNQLKSEFEKASLPLIKSLNGLRLYHILSSKGDQERANYYYEEVKKSVDEKAIHEILSSIQFEN